MNNSKTSLYLTLGAIIVLILVFAYLIFKSTPTDGEISSVPNPISVIDAGKIKDVGTQLSTRYTNGITPSTSSIPVKVAPVSRDNPFQ